MKINTSLHEWYNVSEKENLVKKLALIENSIDPAHRDLVLLERFEESDAKRLMAKIDNIKSYAEKYNLDTLKAGASKAATSLAELTGLLGVGGKIKNIVTFGKGMTKIIAFSAAVTKGFKSLPTVLDLLNQIEGFDKNSAQPLSSTLGEDQQQKFLKGVASAFQPPGIMGAIRGLPFVSNAEFANELLTKTSYPQLTQLVNDPSSPATSDAGVEKSDVKQVVAAAEGQPEPEPQQAAPEESEEERKFKKGWIRLDNDARAAFVDKNIVPRLLGASKNMTPDQILQVLNLLRVKL